MFNARTFAHLFLAITGCAASGLVYAATDADLLGLPWPQIAVAGVIALWGGLTRTSERALEFSIAQRNRLDESQPVPQGFHLWPEVWRAIWLSGGIGFLVYGLCSSMGLGRFETGGAIFLSGYLGSRLLGALGDMALARLGDLVDNLRRDGPKQ